MSDVNLANYVVVMSWILSRKIHIAFWNIWHIGLCEKHGCIWLNFQLGNTWVSYFNVLCRLVHGLVHPFTWSWTTCIVSHLSFRHFFISFKFSLPFP